jgi:hypothetical protein
LGQFDKNCGKTPKNTGKSLHFNPRLGRKNLSLSRGLATPDFEPSLFGNLSGG